MRSSNGWVIVGIIVIMGMALAWMWDKYENRPCIMMERKIIKNYDSYGPLAQGDIARKVVSARMYSELAANGCPENADKYQAAYNRELEEVKGLISAQNAAVVGAEIKIDAKRVADAVNQAAAATYEAIGGMLDKLKDTKINITIE